MYVLLYTQMKIRDAQVEALQFEKDELDSKLLEINAKYYQVSTIFMACHISNFCAHFYCGFSIGLPPTYTHPPTPHPTHTHQEKEELLRRVSELEDELHTAREERERVNSELQLSIKQSSSLKEVCIE